MHIAAPDHNICTAPRYNKRTAQHGTRHGTARGAFPEQSRKFAQDQRLASNVTIRDTKTRGTRRNQNRFPFRPGRKKLVHSPFLIYSSQHFFYFPYANIFFQKIFYNIFFYTLWGIMFYILI